MSREEVVTFLHEEANDDDCIHDLCDTHCMGIDEASGTSIPGFDVRPTTSPKRHCSRPSSLWIL